MRVALVAPLDRRSAVGAATVRSVAPLHGRWDVEQWHPPTTTPRAVPWPTAAWDSVPDLASELTAYDLVVHVLGNSQLHLGQVALARRAPGLVVLHDVVLTHLVVAEAALAGLDPAAAGFAGGTDPADRAELAELVAAPGGGDPRRFERLALRMPLVAPVLRDSLGVVTHSAYAAARVRDLTMGATSVAPLPVLGPAGGPRAGRVRSAGFRLVVAGVLNANKCVDRLLDAVAGSRILRSAAEVRVVGPGAPGAHEAVLAQAAALGLSDRVTVTGALPRAVYDEELAAAAVLVCLRDPVLEAASASLLEGLATGTAAVVHDAGHYAELPDDAVAKVDSSGGASALAGVLERLQDPAVRGQLGERARAYADSHTPTAYADVLRAAGEDAAALKPAAHALAWTRSLLARVGLAGAPAAQRAAAAALVRVTG
jgi:glycosyltransferase involved in cell wall biosynthesis